MGSGRHYPDCMDDLDAYAVNGIAEGILRELKEYTAETKPSGCWTTSAWRGSRRC